MMGQKKLTGMSSSMLDIASPVSSVFNLHLFDKRADVLSEG